MIQDITPIQKAAIEKVNAQGLRVLICAGTGCVANGSMEIVEKFKEYGLTVNPLGEKDKMTAVPTGCHGFCEQGVLVVIPDLHVTYVRVKLADVDEIVKENLLKDFYMLTLQQANMCKKMKTSNSTKNKLVFLLQTADI